MSVSVLSTEAAAARIKELEAEVAELKKIIADMTKREKAASNMLWNQTLKKEKKAKGLVTLKRDAFKEEELRVLKEEVSRWLGSILSIELSGDTLFDEICNGVLLCELDTTIDPQLKDKLGKVHKNAPKNTVLAHENVNNFLKGATQLGVVPHNLFDSNTLVSKHPNERLVLYTLLSVARAAINYGFEPPEIVKLEQEIENMMQMKKDKKAQWEQGDKKKEDAIDIEVQNFCKKMGIDTIPVKLKFGEYQFGDGLSAHVRIIRDVPLVRYQNKWEQLDAFIMVHSKGSSLSISTGTAVSSEMYTGRTSIVGSTSDESDRGATVSFGAATEIKDKEADENDKDDKDDKDEEEGLTEEQKAKRAERKRLGYDVPALKEFFYLTALSAKMTHPLKEEICQVDTHDLFEKACDQKILFYYFGDWLHKELTKIYLESQHKDRMKLGSTVEKGELRDHRGSMMTSIHTRMARDAEKKEGVVDKTS